MRGLQLLSSIGSGEYGIAIIGNGKGKGKRVLKGEKKIFAG